MWGRCFEAFVEVSIRVKVVWHGCGEHLGNTFEDRCTSSFNICHQDNITIVVKVRSENVLAIDCLLSGALCTQILRITSSQSDSPTIRYSIDASFPMLTTFC